MPPKKDVPLEPDLNPFGAFVNAAVLDAEVDLVLPTEVQTPPKGGKSKSAEQEVVPGPPKLQLVFTLPNVPVPVTGQPTDQSTNGTYSFDFNGTIRRDATFETMIELVNGPAKLAVVDTASGTCLASAKIDMMEFGMGAQSIEPGTMELFPEPDVPAYYSRIVSGRLRRVKLWLTYRSQPGSSEPDLQAEASQAASTAAISTRAAVTAETYPLEDTLPPPEPFSFISPGEKAGFNIIELSVTRVTTVPATLGLAISAVTEGKNPGSVGFTLGLRLPQGPPVNVTSGSYQAVGESNPQDSIIWQPCYRRSFVSADQMKALTEALEDGEQLQVELARFVQSHTWADPVWQAYHAVAALPGVADALLEPGTTAYDSDASSSEQPYKPALQLYDDSAHELSCLPPYAAPAGKSSKTLDEEVPPGSCAWEAAGSRLEGVKITFARPVVLPWSPPPAPSVRVLDQLPSQTQLQPHIEATAARNAYSKDVGDMIKALIKCHRDMQVTLEGKSLDEQVKTLQQQLSVDGRFQQLRSSIKQHGIAIANEVLRKDLEQGPLSQQQADTCLSNLHSIMAAAVFESCVDASARDQIVPSSASSSKHATTAIADIQCQLRRLQQLSKECEEVGCLARAAALHEKRVLLASTKADDSDIDQQRPEEDQSTNSPNATVVATLWYDYAQFCLRRGDAHHGRAEQALKRAIQHDASHLPSMAALAALLLHQGKVTDPLYLKEASVLVQTLVDKFSWQPWAQSLSHMIHQAAGHHPTGATQSTSSSQHAVQSQDSQVDATQETQQQSCSSFLGTANLLTSLHLPRLALEAVQEATPALQNDSASPSLAVGAHVATAQAWAQIHATYQAANKQHQLAGIVHDDVGVDAAQQQQTEAAMQAALAAIQHARSALRSCDVQMIQQSSIDLAVLEGSVHNAAGNAKACIRAMAPLLATPGEAGEAMRLQMPLRAYAELAECYRDVGLHQQAVNVYMQACATIPCATAWVRLAAALVELHGQQAEPALDVDQVQAALTQAAAYDADNPDVWAWLALLAFKSGQTREAASHIKTAMQLNLEDTSLIRNLAQECQQAGLVDQERSCLEILTRSSSAPADVHLQLAKLCLDQGDSTTGGAALEKLMSSVAALPEGSSQRQDLQQEVDLLVPRLLELKMSS